MFGKFSSIMSSKIFLYPFFFSSSSGTSVILMLVHLISSQRSLETILSSFHSFYFILLFRSHFHHFTFQLTDLSASDILLLIPSRVFLISVIVLFATACLFFNSSSYLVIDSCIFSILFSRFLIIFAIIILNSFSAALACRLLHNP